MEADVGLEATTLGEALGAVGALVWLHAGMGPHVPIEKGFLNKRLLTKLTGVRPFPCVVAPVHPECTHVVECPLALGTFYSASISRLWNLGWFLGLTLQRRTLTKF